ncbi:MAG: hypothetical protein FOGNACKC_03305 [Anaerolineae bacterium]|nr:hypothetical protein [Anaerolineae bacterium]
MLPKQIEFYEIKVKGHLDKRHIKMMEELNITHLPSGESLLIGPIADQSALYGLLNRLRDLGVPLVSVNRAEH